MKATQYTGIYAGKNAVRMEFLYRHQRCRETVRVAPSTENLKKIHQKLERVKMLIQFGEFDYFKEFPESKY